MTLRDELRLIKEGCIEETHDSILETEISDIGLMMFESAMDMCLIEGDTDVIIEAALNVFDKIGMMLFQKFNKLDEIAKEDISKFTSLKKDIIASKKETYYVGSVDINNINKICRLLLKIYNDSPSGTKVFEILGDSKITVSKFNNDEVALNHMLDTDIENTKKLLGQAKMYRKIRDVDYTVDPKDTSPIDEYIKNKHQVIIDIANMRKTLQAKITKYTSEIKAANNPNIPGYKGRLTKLVSKALNTSIYILNQTVQLYILSFNDNKDMYNQIKSKL